MRIWTTFGVAIRSLRRASNRSSLTALGVVVGVAAVIVTTSIGNGAKAEIQETLDKPESRTIHLIATAPLSVSGNARPQLTQEDLLQLDDYHAIRESVRNISAASPRIYVNDTRGQANGREKHIRLEAIDVEGFTTVPRTLLAGALFNHADVQRANPVCVLSETLAFELFPDGRFAGRRVRINGASFTVIGVVDDILNYAPTMFRAEDLHVYVPFTSFRRRIDPNGQLTISVRAIDVEHVEEVQQSIDDLMEQRRNSRRAHFRTSTAFESIRLRAEGSNTIARLLAAVGAVSLIVGGIGIMNIMLVSVTERTREIGVRMAVGTRDGSILRQFLIEAIVLSLLGGLVGIAVGWAVSWFIARANDWPVSVTPGSIAIALMCSLVVGVFFGYHPARRAAGLNPVEALRTEG